MLRVGLTGGLATGKSFVAAVLESLGCKVLHADKLGHEALSPGGEAYEPVIEEFGPEVLGAGGVINRKRLAGIVFADPVKLKRLNSFVHPAVFRMEDAWFDMIAATEPDAIGVVEAAILMESGSYKRYDRLILTVCGRELQIQRAVQRGLTVAEAEARIARQLPDSEKRKLAHYVIETTGSKEATAEQTQNVYERLRSFVA